MKKSLYLLTILTIIFFIMSFKVMANVDGLTFYIDKKNSVHFMWQSDNNQKNSSLISIHGAENRLIQTDDSHSRVDGLPPGSYHVTIQTGDQIEEVDFNLLPLPRQPRSAGAVTVSSIELISLDKSLYPEIALQFRVWDDSGNPHNSLARSSFSLTEELIQLSVFDFSKPDVVDFTRMADIVVVFDDTGSMGAEIGYLKENIVKFVDTLVESGVSSRFRLISYKDNANDGWSWTEDAVLFKTHIESLQASGGNGTEEDAFEALDIAGKYHFRSGVQRIFLLITDAPSWGEGVDEYGNPTPLKSDIISLLQTNSIVLYAIAYYGDQYYGPGSLSVETGGKWYPITDDFSDIVDDIGELVGGSYKISYRTPNTPDTFMGEDASDIQVVLTHDDTATVLTTSYTYNSAPKITYYMLEPTTVSEGNSITVYAHVNDPEKEGLLSAALFYQEGHASATWTKISSIDPLKNNTVIRFVIPGDDVTTNGINYYIRVSDSQNVQGFYPKIGSHFLPVDEEIMTLDIKYLSSYIDPESLDLYISYTLEGISDASALSFHYYASDSDAFTGIPSKEISDNPSEQISYNKLSEDSFQVIFRKNSLAEIAVLRLEITEKSNSVLSRNIYYTLGTSALNTFILNKANTFIVTDFNKMNSEMSEYSSDIESLKETIRNVVHETWDMNTNGIPFATNEKEFNMLPVLVDLGNVTVLDTYPGMDSNPFQRSFYKHDGSTYTLDTASEIVSALYSFRRNEGFVRSSDDIYLILVGSTEIIPFGSQENQHKHIDKSNETDWYNNSLGTDLAPALENQFSDDHYPSDDIYRQYFKTGRLVELPSHISSLFNHFMSKKGYALIEKQFLYIGGYDKNNKESGFLVTKTIQDKLNERTEKDWDTSASIYRPKGFSGKTVVEKFNSVSSGLVHFGTHGHYYLMNFANPSTTSSWCEKLGVANGLFYAHRKICDGDVLEINQLSNFIVLTNACHSGVNFHSEETNYEGSGTFDSGEFGDFPEAFVNDKGDIVENRSLSIYVANSSFGIYCFNGVCSGDKLLAEAINNLVGSDNDKIVYDAVFTDNLYIKGSKDSSKVKDLKARPVFYGIPNYRKGPNVLKRRSSLSNDDITILEGSQFIDTNVSFNDRGLSLDITLDITDSFLFDSNTGELHIYGIESKDDFKRPYILWKLALPEGSSVSSTEIIEDDTQIISYSTPVSVDLCIDEGCTEIVMETSEFAQLTRFSASIESNYLWLRFSPVQYKTITTQAKISKMIHARVIVETASYIPDNDADNLPDYWEMSYGLDYSDPSGDNGPNGDPDEDGVLNLKEYLDFTNPKLPNEIIQDTTPPPVPEFKSSQKNEHDASFTFEIGDGTTHVQLFYGTEPDQLTQTSAKQNIDAANIYLSGLKDNTTYYVSMRAFDEAGNMSEACTPTMIQTQVGIGPALPNPPYTSGKTIIVENPAEDDFAGYNVYISSKSDLSNAKVMFVSPDPGNETRISFDTDTKAKKGRSQVNQDDLFVQISAVDIHGHEGKASKIFAFQTFENPVVRSIPSLNMLGVFMFMLLLCMLGLKLGAGRPCIQNGG